MEEGFVEVHHQESFLVFLFRSLGMRYAFLIPLVALAAFVIVLIVVIRGKGPFAVSAMVFAIAMPLLVGLNGALDGMLASYQVIAMSTQSPKPNEIAQGVSMSLVAPLVAMFFTTPAFFTALVGSLLRSLLPDSQTPK